MNPKTDTPESAEAMKSSDQFAILRLRSLAEEIADNGHGERWPRRIRDAVENIKDDLSAITARHADTAARLQQCETALREDRFVTSPHNKGETWKQAAVRLQTRRDELNAKLTESEREREAMLSALIKTTGSLGLIIKGAGAQGPGHLENYNCAKLLLNQIAAKEDEAELAALTHPTRNEGEKKG